MYKVNRLTEKISRGGDWTRTTKNWTFAKRNRGLAQRYWSLV